MVTAMEFNLVRVSDVLGGAVPLQGADAPT
jgi:hypothetical protein